MGPPAFGLSCPHWPQYIKPCLLPRLRHFRRILRGGSCDGLAVLPCQAIPSRGRTNLISLRNHNPIMSHAITVCRRDRLPLCRFECACSLPLGQQSTRSATLLLRTLLRYQHVVVSNWTILISFYNGTTVQSSRMKRTSRCWLVKPLLLCTSGLTVQFSILKYLRR